MKDIQKYLAKAIDPVEIATEFIDQFPIYYDQTQIWWMWDKDKKAWQNTDETDILNLLRGAFELQGITYSGQKNAFIQAIKLVAREKKPISLPKNCLQFKDTIVNYMLPDEEWWSSTPNYFCINPIPWKLGKSEDTPEIDALFESWVGKEQKRLLYEICAFALNTEYFPNRIWVFVGKGSNGKGTFLNFLERFVGQHNCASSELDLLMENRFESMKLYKKLLVFMGETNFNTLRNTARLKSLTGRDLTNFEIKGGRNFSAYNYAKLIISTNSLPTTQDKSDGFYRRFAILDWDNQFAEKKDVIGDIPTVEYENLARKCLRLLKEINQRGCFAGEGSIQERAKKYEEKSDPLAHFITEKCEQDINAEIKSYEFTQFFLSWLNERGYRKLSEVEIGRQLKEKGYEKKSRHYTKDDGQQGTYNVILGLRWSASGKLDGDDGDDGAIPFHSYNKQRSENTLSSPSSPSEPLLLPCSRCDAPPPCHYQDAKSGRPLCEFCANLNPDLRVNEVTFDENEDT